MSMPALRQPKKRPVEAKKSPPASKTEQKKSNEPKKEPLNYLIVTLRSGKKLVVSSDSYHGILTSGELFRCVFCETEMVRDVLCKERHKSSENHRKIVESYPHVEEFNENLIRKLNGADHYCTICNVVVTTYFLHKHIAGESHMDELQMAITRALAYKPNV
ncbi:hypothetical protein PYW07_012729 [Mythimna separata]|uniref:C2H2-type domain-containing protein n=1 Tax=Mythimna separata TaxID=271217 RepID=A0AAD7Y8W9_MYTSE|nr:hypothetical protein PYW07_012729 [Mythimna separata]